MGLLPDGETQEERDERLRIAAADADATASDLDMSLTLRQAMRRPTFYLLSFAFSLGFMIVSGTGFHLVSYLTDRGMSPENGVTTLFLWSAAALGGILISGVIMGRVRVKAIVVVDMVIVGLSFVVLMAADSARWPTPGRSSSACSRVACS